jgi:hypothetical protein
MQAKLNVLRLQLTVDCTQQLSTRWYAIAHMRKHAVV